MNILKKIILFIVKSTCCIIGLFILLFIWGEVSMISHSFIDEELKRMGLYEDLPDFPDYKICGYRHKWKKSRYDYTLKLNPQITPASISIIDSLCHTYEGHLRWHHDREKGQYTLFLWDIAKDYDVYLMIIPGKKTVKFVYNPRSRLPWFEESYDLFRGPIYGESLFYKRLSKGEL